MKASLYILHEVQVLHQHPLSRCYSVFNSFSPSTRGSSPAPSRRNGNMMISLKLAVLLAAAAAGEFFSSLLLYIIVRGTCTRQEGERERRNDHTNNKIIQPQHYCPVCSAAIIRDEFFYPYYCLGERNYCFMNCRSQIEHLCHERLCIEGTNYTHL